VLVVDDGSTDATADVARAAGAHVVSFDENRGLPHAVAAGYRYAREHDYGFCGRVDADGQHVAAELRRLLERVRSGGCDVAVGSRFVAGEGYPEYRYRPSPERAFGTALLRRLMRLRTGKAFGDATSGLYAVNARAAAVLAEPYVSEAPEVEGLIRLREAGLLVDEVPVDMRERASGESKLTGKKALKVVMTIGGTLVVGRRVVRRLRR
jgi:glycosyltransferase involved in cell wall biosynthesis